ncbi:MAG: hypothetical protein IJ785_06485 [Bacteroidales bacterium]|nr:hypothetical protein [Bacteroidales bacterium]
MKKKRENLADSPLLRPLIERRRRAEQSPSLTDEELALIFNASRSFPSEPLLRPVPRRRPLWPRVAALLVPFLLGAAALLLLPTPGTPAPGGPALAQVVADPTASSAPLPSPLPLPAAAKSSPRPARHNPATDQPPTPATSDSLPEAESFLALEALPAPSDDLGISLTPPPSFSFDGAQYDHFICSSDVCDTLLFFYQVHIDLMV